MFWFVILKNTITGYLQVQVGYNIACKPNITALSQVMLHSRFTELWYHILEDEDMVLEIQGCEAHFDSKFHTYYRWPTMPEYGRKSWILQKLLGKCLKIHASTFIPNIHTNLRRFTALLLPNFPHDGTVGSFLSVS